MIRRRSSAFLRLRADRLAIALPVRSQCMSIDLSSAGQCTCGIGPRNSPPLGQNAGYGKMGQNLKSCTCMPIERRHRSLGFLSCLRSVWVPPFWYAPIPCPSTQMIMLPKRYLRLQRMHATLLIASRPWGRPSVPRGEREGCYASMVREGSVGGWACH